MSVHDLLLETYQNGKTGYWVLLDPDKLPVPRIPAFMAQVTASRVDALLIGGSLILNSDFESFVKEIKKYANGVPVILFPGSIYQVTPDADAMLFLSLISGREAQHLIGSQVLAAPLLYRTGLEPIATAYMLIDSGKPTAAQFMSGTMPLPRHKPEITVAHALAAQYLGFKLIYLEAGSGADQSVPEEMIAAVTRAVNIPVIVGGGILTPQEAAAKRSAGATFIVTGNVLESTADPDLMHQFSEAIHKKN
ncbi:MAG: geranylgeranylglyceryl/heptaprenylglyceryl phosphate synthase [Calditrichales bacterium]|nr:MAG: geranylgeranylglyceryl/heptaprenylglyceryl phosphate synthase [Calditrichales bacterium]